MRIVALCSWLVLCGVACQDDDPHVDPNAQTDSGAPSAADKDAATRAPSDAGSRAASALRPSLARPAKGLPPELRPPR